MGKRLGSLRLAADTTQRVTRNLLQLYFRKIFAREDTIEDANKNTFRWIMMPDSDDCHSEVDSHYDAYIREENEDRKKAKALVQDWLATGSGILHLSGKADAGKSILMNLLHKHPRTKELIQEWAGDKSLVYVLFFSWNSGRKL